MLRAMTEPAEENPAPAIPGDGTPEGDLLREALHAFDAGNYALVRARTRALADAKDAGVRAAAADLESRIAVDPIQVVVVLACAAVLFAIIWHWVL